VAESEQRADHLCRAPVRSTSGRVRPAAVTTHEVLQQHLKSAEHVRGPQLTDSRRCAEAHCAGWLGPAVAHAFPAIVSDASIYTAIRAAGDIGGAWSGRTRHRDEVWLHENDEEKQIEELKRQAEQMGMVDTLG
jgi:hypothetical protein